MEQAEGYVAVDQSVLAAIREFAWVADYDKHTLPAIRLILRVARIDPESGALLIAVEVSRQLEEGGEHGLGSI